MNDMKRRLRDMSPAQIAALAHRLENDGATESPAPGPRPTRLQRRLWIAQQAANDTGGLNSVMALDLEGELDRERLRHALETVIARHPILRTTYRSDGSYGPSLPPANAFVWTVHDIARQDPSASATDALLTHTAARSFDLESGPLVRVAIVVRGPTSHSVVFSIHHVAFDAWSRNVLLDELATAYGGDSATLRAPPDHMAYAARERIGPNDDERARSRDYWSRQVANLPPSPLDIVPHGAARRTSAARTIRATLANECWTQVQAAAQSRRTTPFAVALAAFAHVLYGVSAQADIALITSVAARDDAATARMVGPLIDTLLLRFDLAEAISVGDAIDIASRTFRDALAHRCTTFDEVVELSGRPAEQGAHPLSRIALVLDPSPPFRWPVRGIEASTRVLPDTQSPFDLMLLLTPEGPSPTVSVEYRTGLISPDAAQAIVDAFVHVISTMAGDPLVPLAAIGLLPPDAMAERVAAGRGAPSLTAELPADIAQVFVNVASRVPGAVAVRAAGEHVTYAQLLSRACHWAAHLRSLGCESGTLVAVALPRGVDFFAAMLATAMSGATFLLVDIAQAPARVSVLITEAAPGLVLTREGIVEGLGLPAWILTVDIDGIPMDGAPSGELMAATQSGDGRAAYRIYTSGSSGKPKAIDVSHRSMVDLARWQRAYFGLSAGHVVSQLSTPSFDAIIGEFCMSLLCGGTLAVVDDEDRTPEQFEDFLVAQAVDVAVVVPSFLARMSPDVVPEAASRWLVVVGEAFSPGLAARWLSRRRVVNAYGPAEFTVYATAYEVQHADGENGANPLPIGQVRHEARAYVLDHRGWPMPCGLPGELYLAGSGVAIGYAGAVTATAARFVPDPFSGIAAPAVELRSAKAQASIDALRDLSRPTARASITGIGTQWTEADIERHCLGLDPASVGRTLELWRLIDSAEGRHGFVRYLVEGQRGLVQARGLDAEVIERLLGGSLAGKRGADLGSGGGEVLDALRELGAEAIGVDISPWLVERSRRRGHRVVQVPADGPLPMLALATGVSAGSLDFVLSTLLLDRVASPLQLLENMLGMLRPGGRFALQMLLPHVAFDVADATSSYTAPDRRIADGEDVASQREAIVRCLTRLGAVGMATFRVPYAIATSEGFEHMMLWSVTGTQSAGRAPLGQRMYRTGDRALLGRDGKLVFLGRVDRELKARGARLDPAEVERVLEAHPSVARAFVGLRDIAADGGAPSIVAWCVRRKDAGSDDRLADAVLAWAGGRLSSWAVPRRIEWLDELPLGPSGKPDESLLQLTPSTRRETIAPRDSTETCLLEACRFVLGPRMAGIDDSVFDAGADSISLLRISARLQAVGLTLDIRDYFECRTVRRLAGRVSGFDAVTPFEGTAGLSPIQSWAVRMAGPPDSWQMQWCALALAENPGCDALASALAQVVRVHDALRSQVSEDGIAVLAPDHVSLHISTATTREAALFQAAASLEPQAGRMLTAAIVPGEPAELVLVASHFATDAMSWKILGEDLAAALAGRPLRAPATSHLHALRAMAREAEDVGRLAETAFWLVSIDGGRAAGEGPVASVADVCLDDRTTRACLDAASRLDAPVHALLHAALARLLAAASGGGRACIDIESNGRAWPDLDLARTVGWFTALYPVAVDLDPSADRVEHARASALALANVPVGGISFQLLADRHPDPAVRTCLRAWRAPVVLNYLGRVVSEGGVREGMPLIAFGGATPPADVDAPYPVAVDAWIDGRGRLSLRIQCTAHSILGSATALRDALVEEIKAIGRDTLATLPFRLAASTAPGVRLSSIRARADDCVEVAALNPMQSGMVFHSRAAPGTGVYENQMRFRLEGAFDTSRWDDAWRDAVQAEPALRTAFANVDGTWLRFVRRTAVAAVDEHDLRHASPSADEAANLVAQTERRRSFSLDEAPLARMNVLRLGESRWEVLWTFHHLVMDGWSVATMLYRLLRRYASAGPATPIEAAPLADLPGSRAARYAEACFWSTQLRGAACSDPLRLGPIGNPGGLSAHQCDATHVIDQDATARIVGMANRAGVTLATYLQAAWAWLLARRSGDAEVIFGLTVSGRDAQPHLDDAVGLFVTSIPVRVAAIAAMPPSTLIKSVHEAANARRRFEATPLADIHRFAGVASPASLFNHVLLIENFPIKQAIDSVPPELELTSLACRQRSHYPATLVIVPGERLTLELSWEAGRLTTDEAESILAELRGVLERLGRPDVATLGGIPRPVPVIPGSSEAFVAAPRAPGYADTTIHAAFARTVERLPYAVALVDGARTLTYAQLDGWTNRLAHALLTRGVRPEDRIGLFAGRSFESVVGILAILKAGASWVPLDPTYPAQRLLQMVRSSAPAAFLVQHPLPEGIFDDMKDVQWLDIAAFADGPEVPPPQVAVTPDHMAYVLFTSGSTGTPKGVVGTHRSTLAVAAWREECFPHASHECCIHKTPLGFGDSIQEILGPLLAGVSLAFPSVEAVRDPHRFVEELRAWRVSRLIIVPSLLTAVLTSSAKVETLADALLWIASGEALPATTVRLFRERLPHARLVNLYGVSEAACDATWADVVDERTAPSIGMPVAGASIHLLDAGMRPVISGALGEIHIGGEVVNRGYLGDARQTASAFVPDPAARGGRLFRTRDLGRFTADGLTYHGRADQQINLRGMRIETAEVEAAMASCPGVADAAVVLDSGSLVGWIVPDERETLLMARDFRVTPDGLAVFDYRRGETDYVLQEFDEGHTPLPVLADGATVIDVGANIGLYSLAAHYAANDVRIVAVEPAPPLVPILRRNLVLHGCTFELLPCVLGSRPGRTSFTFYPRASLESGCHADREKDARIFRESIAPGTTRADDVERLLEGRFEGERVDIEMTTLGEIVDRLDTVRIDLVKIDVERSEREVLEGLAPCHFERIGRFIVEVEEQGGTRQAIEALFPPGFSLKWTRHGRLGDVGLWMLDALNGAWPPADGAARKMSDSVPLASLSEASVRRRLADLLPGHMIPARVHFAGHLPTTPSGKLDRRALARMAPATPTVAVPDDPVERMIVGIWREILKRDDIDVNDNFFDTGGHSLLVLQVLDRLATAGHDISVADFYLFPSIATLADFLRRGRRDEGHERAASRGERRRRRARERTGTPHV